MCIKEVCAVSLHDKVSWYSKVNLGTSKTTLCGPKYNKREVEFSQMKKEENKNLTKHYNCHSKK